MSQSFRTVLLVLGLLGCAMTHATDEVVISDDGRQIRLNGDGTWVQLSKDRYATNAAGQRVRLRPDGTWAVLADVSDQIVAQTARAPGASNAPSAVAALQDIGILLTEVVVLKRAVQRAKTTHAEVRTVYTLRINNHSQRPLVWQDLARQLSARSSRGARFDLRAVTPSSGQLAPGAQAQIEVVAQGGPRWFGVKFLSLEIASGALGNPVKRILAKNMDEVVRRDVERF